MLQMPASVTMSQRCGVLPSPVPAEIAVSRPIDKAQAASTEVALRVRNCLSQSRV